MDIPTSLRPLWPLSTNLLYRSAVEPLSARKTLLQIIWLTRERALNLAPARHLVDEYDLEAVRAGLELVKDARVEGYEIPLGPSLRNSSRSTSQPSTRTARRRTTESSLYRRLSSHGSGQPLLQEPPDRLRLVRGRGRTEKECLEPASREEGAAPPPKGLLGDDSFGSPGSQRSGSYLDLRRLRARDVESLR